MRVISKVTSKYQATIPLAVREALGIKQGDAVAFDLEDGQVTLRRAQAIDMLFAQALPGTLQEWGSEADEKAYDKL